MRTPDNRKAWADFWAQGPAAGDPAAQSGTMKEIEAAQRTVWQAFARSLPKGARILDLATGDGAVLKKIREARADLHLLGVDSSPALPPPPRGMALRAGVAMESLPFGDGAFDAITSQFGFEYGDTASASREVGRLLAPGGRLLLLVHRRDGPIVAHNLPRAEALRWALAPGGHFAKARGLVAARRIAAIATPPAFRHAPQEVQRLFPDQTVGAEFLEAVLRTLDVGRHKPVEESLEVLDALERKARNEIARIETLERAACDAGRIESICAQLRAARIDVDPPEVVAQPSGRAFAWLLSGARPR